MKLVLFCLILLFTLVTPWNLRCYMRAEYGDCKGHSTMWAYSKFKKECIRFEYSGCGGNVNRFHSKFDCELRCYALRLETHKVQSQDEWYKY